MILEQETIQTLHSLHQKWKDFKDTRNSKKNFGRENRKFITMRDREYMLDKIFKLLGE